MNARLLACLCCPVDRTALREVDDRSLACERGHTFPVVEGVPVMLRDDAEQTMPLVQESLKAARRYEARLEVDPLYLASLGVSDEQRKMAAALASGKASPVDPVVSVVIAATSGYAYEHLVGHLDHYPIPDLRLPDGKGKRLLDVGCNWGRWSIAAARKGYRVVGLDPSLSAVMAATRTARNLGLDIDYVCADARYLPFKDGSFDTFFSYSVIQHFSKEDARKAFAEAGRVLAAEGSCLVQMAHAVGIRSLYHRMRRGFSEGERFEVRYWTIPELRSAFAPHFDRVALTVHCFFGLGLEPTDTGLMPPRIRALIGASERLRRWSLRWPALGNLADSLYVSATKDPGGARHAAP